MPTLVRSTSNPLGPNRTGVRLVLEYDPEGFAEKVGDWLNVVSRQAQSDLEKFKEFIESQGAETGAWRGTVSGGSAAGEGPGGASGSVGAEGGTGDVRRGAARIGGGRLDRGWNAHRDDRLAGHAGRRCRCPGQCSVIRAAEADDLIRRARPAPLVRHEVRRVHLVPHKLR